MRRLLTMAVLAGTIGMAAAQPADDDGPPPPRYAVASNPGLFPQKSPKDAVASVLRAADRGRTDYLVAHLMDPAFVDARVAERLPQVLPTAERELRELRDRQRANPNQVPVGGRLPDEPAAFNLQVRLRAEVLAFAILLRDVQDTLADNPDHLKELRRFARDGVLAEDGDTAKLTVEAIKDREVFLRRAGGRWFVLDRQQPAPTAPAPAAGK